MAEPMDFRIVKRTPQPDGRDLIEAYGKSTATKATGFASGSTFFAIDTQTIYMYEETEGEWYDVGGDS